MKSIKLYGKNVTNEECIVDDEDFEYLNQFKWYLHKWSGKLYAKRFIVKENGKTTTTSMHRDILKLSDRSIFADHINNNGLDNQKINLRLATRSQNAVNSNRKNGRKSVYKGVIFVITNGSSYWVAISKKDGKEHRKYFKTETEAAAGYNEMAIKFHGEFAILNILTNYKKED